MIPRQHLRFTTVFALAAALSTLASADPIAGTTTGLFSNGSSTHLDGLSYTANEVGFNVASAPNGSFTVGGSNNDNLGLFQITPSNFTYNGNTFTLTVAFTQPAIANSSFTAALSGQVTSTGDGGANIDFGMTPQTIPVSGGRTLTFWANSMSLTPGSGSVALTGRGTLTPVPEPASVGALLVGLFAFAHGRRRRA